MPEPRRRDTAGDKRRAGSSSERPRAGSSSEKRRAGSSSDKPRAGSQPENSRAEAREDHEAERGSAPRKRRQPPISGLIGSAREQLEELIGRPISATLGFERQDDNWQLTVEVVELERIPETTSILGCYRALVDDDGELLEYRRVRRYSRSQPDADS